MLLNCYKLDKKHPKHLISLLFFFRSTEARDCKNKINLILKSYLIVLLSCFAFYDSTNK